MNIILEEIISGLPDVRTDGKPRFPTVDRDDSGRSRWRSARTVQQAGRVKNACTGSYGRRPVRARSSGRRNGVGRNIARDSGHHHGDRIYRGRRHSQTARKKRDRRSHDGGWRWMTAAVGIAAGLGRLGLAVVSTILTWITLSALQKIEARMNQKQ